MQAKATANNLRISPRKARLVINSIRGLRVGVALSKLDSLPNKATFDVVKVLKSAMANADQSYSIDIDDLKVCLAYVDEGSILKRFRPRAMGRAFSIRKRTSHITIVVGK